MLERDLIRIWVVFFERLSLGFGQGLFEAADRDGYQDVAYNRSGLAGKGPWPSGRASRPLIRLE